MRVEHCGEIAHSHGPHDWFHVATDGLMTDVHCPGQASTSIPPRHDKPVGTFVILLWVYIAFGVTWIIIFGNAPIPTKVLLLVLSAGAMYVTAVISAEWRRHE